MQTGPIVTSSGQHRTNHGGREIVKDHSNDQPTDIASRPPEEDTDRHLVFGTGDGVWRMSGDNAERIALAGKIVVHVADRNGTVLAAVARDGVYEISDSGERHIWGGRRTRGRNRPRRQILRGYRAGHGLSQ